MPRHGSPSLRVKLAAALVCLRDAKGEFLIPWEDAKQMTATQIISLFHFDHWPTLKADGGPDEPWNLVPRLIASHRRKTAEVDIPQIAKTKRIATQWTQHQAKMFEKEHGWLPDEYQPRFQRPKRKIPSRPFPKGKRKVRRA